MNSQFPTEKDPEIDGSNNKRPTNKIVPWDVARCLIQICLFKAKPQDLPTSRNLVFALAVLSVAVNLTFNQPGQRFFESMTIATAQVVLFGFTVWLVLKIRSRTGRWIQTITAVYGTTAIIRLLSWPFASIIFAAMSVESQAAFPPSFIFSALAFFALGIWSLVILVMIFREAMEVSKLVSFFLTVALILIVPFVILELHQMFFSPNQVVIG